MVQILRDLQSSKSFINLLLTLKFLLQLLFPLTLLLDLKIVIYKLRCQVGIDRHFDVQLLPYLKGL